MQMNKIDRELMTIVIANIYIVLNMCQALKNISSLNPQTV